jgi:hypothetical protein
MQTGQWDLKQLTPRSHLSGVNTRVCYADPGPITIGVHAHRHVGPSGTLPHIAGTQNSGVPPLRIKRSDHTSKWPPQSTTALPSLSHLIFPLLPFVLFLSLPLHATVPELQSPAPRRPPPATTPSSPRCRGRRDHRSGASPCSCPTSTRGANLRAPSPASSPAPSASGPQPRRRPRRRGASPRGPAQEERRGSPRVAGTACSATSSRAPRRPSRLVCCALPPPAPSLFNHSACNRVATRGVLYLSPALSWTLGLDICSRDGFVCQLLMNLLPVYWWNRMVVCCILQLYEDDMCLCILDTKPLTSG